MTKIVFICGANFFSWIDFPISQKVIFLSERTRSGMIRFFRSMPPQGVFLYTIEAKPKDYFPPTNLCRLFFQRSELKFNLRWLNKTVVLAQTGAEGATLWQSPISRDEQFWLYFRVLRPPKVFWKNCRVHQSKNVHFLRLEFFKAGPPHQFEL